MTKTKTKGKLAAAVELGRLGGLVKSPKKTAAVRRNALKAGRKRRDGLPTLTAERKAAGISYDKPAPKPRAVKPPPPPKPRKVRAPSWEF